MKPPVPGIPGNGSGGGGSSGFGNLDLGKIVSGLYDAYGQDKASREMLDWLKSRTDITDNLYKPGSAEYNALWDEMSRKDAAAGRNSQYGPRSVDLAARIAQIKAAENTKMTTGIGQWMNGSINQKNTSLDGLLAALGGQNSGNGITVDGLARLFTNGANSWGNSTYDPGTGSGGWSDTANNNFFYGNGSSGD
jgi:hypothetical protein